MTLDDLEILYGRINIDHYCQRRNCSRLNVLSSDVYITLISQTVPPLKGVKQGRGGVKELLYSYSIIFSIFNML